MIEKIDVMKEEFAEILQAYLDKGEEERDPNITEFHRRAIFLNECRRDAEGIS